MLVGVKIHFQLMDTGGRPSDAWDAVSNERVGGETVVATTDAAGEFTVDLWPNTRGNRTTKYKCRVQFEGFREFSGIVEDVPGELQWVDFMLGGSAMEPQDMSAIAAAMTSHINAADPHTQYAKESDLGNAAVLDVGTTTGTVAAGDDPRLLAVADKVDKVAGKGLSTEDYSTAEKNKLAGIDVTLDAAVAAAEAARDAAVQGAIGLFPTTAAGIGQGVQGTSSLVPGSGGTNGTFALAFSGGTQVIAPTGRFVVAGGAVTQVIIDYPGYYSAGTPTISLAASAGLTGASVIATMGPNTPLGEYFSVPSAVVGEALIIYQNVAGTGVEKIRTSSAAAESMTRAEIRAATEITQRIGKIDTPVTGVDLSGTTYVFAMPVNANGHIRKVTLFAKSVGAIKVKRFTKSGNVFTFVAEVSIVISATGVQTFDDSKFGAFPVQAGEYIGFYVAAGVLSIVAGSADASSYWYGDVTYSDITTSFTDASVSVVSQHQIAFDIGTTVLTSNDYASVRESAANSSSKLDQLFQDVLIGRAAPVTGSMLPSYSWIFDSPIPSSGILTGWSIYGMRAGEVTLLVLSRLGSVFTRVYEKTVTIALGLNTFFDSIDVSEGHYLGVSIPAAGGSGAYVSGVADPVGWLFGSATDQSFTASWNGTSSTMQFGFTLSLVKSASDAIQDNPEIASSLPGLTRQSGQTVVGAGDSSMVGVHGFYAIQNQASECPPGLGSWFYLLRDAIHRNDPFFKHADELGVVDNASGTLISVNPASQKYTLPFNGIATYFSPVDANSYVEFDYKHFGSSNKCWIHTLQTNDGKAVTFDVKVNGVTRVSGFSTAPVTGNYAGLTPVAVEVPNVPNDGSVSTIRITNCAMIGGGSGKGVYICGASSKYSAIENTGYGGQSSSWMLANLAARVLNYNPKLVVFSIGANDHYKGVSAKQTEANINDIISACRASNPLMQMLFVGPPFSDESITPNSIMAETSRRIEKACAERGCRFISTQRLLANVDPALYRYDAIHMTKDGNTIIAMEVIRVLMGLAILQPDLIDANINYFGGATR